MNVSDDSEDEAIAQQAALAQQRFGNQTKKPVANQDVSIDSCEILVVFVAAFAGHIFSSEVLKSFLVA